MAGEPRTLTDGLNEERKEGRTIEDDPRFWGGGRMVLLSMKVGLEGGYRNQ